MLTVVFTLVLGGSLESVDPVGLFWDQLRLLLINFILVNLWEETAWAGVMQTRLERLHNIFVAAVLTAIPSGYIRLPLDFLSEITMASVLISLPAYWFFALPAALVESSSEVIATPLVAGLMHSVFNRTNNDNGIAASLLDRELYGLGILIAVVVLIAALALLAGRRRLSRAYRLELDANPGGVAAPAYRLLDIAVRVARDLIAGLRHTKKKKQPSRRHPSGQPTKWPRDPYASPWHLSGSRRHLMA